MVNPFGEDDDDFEVNWLIDRNFRISYMIVDEMNAEFPEMVKDQYWDSKVPEELYYTENTLKYKTEGYAGSAAAAAADKDNASVRWDDKSMNTVRSRPAAPTQKHGSLAFLPFHLGQQKHHHHQAHTATNPEHEQPISQLFDRTFAPKKTDSDQDLMAVEDKDKQGSTRQ